jgi:hypothetical protein
MVFGSYLVAFCLTFKGLGSGAGASWDSHGTYSCSLDMGARHVCFNVGVYVQKSLTA